MFSQEVVFIYLCLYRNI